MKIQPAVKKETGHIACWSGAGTILMIVAFAVCHKLFPDAVPFDYKVVLGGVIGAAVSVGNFFIMGLTVQKIASGEQSDEQAYKSMKIVTDTVPWPSCYGSFWQWYYHLLMLRRVLYRCFSPV